MFPSLHKQIASLDDWQTIVCCRLLVLLLDEVKAREPDSGRPPTLTVTDFNQWVQMGGPQVRSLVAALCDRRLAITAAAGRRLMQACLQWGYDDQVLAACRLAHAPVASLGMLSPVTILASLAAVMLWHPERPTLATLLRPERINRLSASAGEKRHYPWLRPLPAEKKTAVPTKE